MPKKQKTEEEILQEYLKNMQIRKIVNFTGKVYTSKSKRKYYYFKAEFSNGQQKSISLPEKIAKILLKTEKTNY